MSILAPIQSFLASTKKIEPGETRGVQLPLYGTVYAPGTCKVYRIRERAVSKGKVPAVAGVPIMNVEKIQPLYQDATDALFEDLKGRLGKIVKKSGSL